MEDLNGKNVLVVGLGASGYTAANLLASRGACVKITESADSPDLRAKAGDLEKKHISCELGGHTSSFCGTADMVVVSPGVDVAGLYYSGIIKKGVDVIGELELGYMFSKGTVVAITGTNGKSTTTELIGKIFARSGRHTVVCGNIGNPLCGEVDSLRTDSVMVIEVSSFQLETIKTFKPHVAILLNVTEDHYDRHGTLKKYKEEKYKIFGNQGKDDWAILHSSFREDPLTGKIKSRKLFFGDEGTEAFVETDGVRITGKNSGGKVKDLFISSGMMSIKGKHNLENVASSVLAARAMGVEDKYILGAMSAFTPLGHRFETVANFMGIEFIDDSKGTNIDSTKRALESMDRKRVVLIAGGRDKGGDYLSILPVVKEKVKAAVLIGEAGERINRAFSGTVPVFMAEDMASAVKKAASVAKKGDAVLLSPMCSSFDMFKDYKHRGDVFREEVKRLTTL